MSQTTNAEAARQLLQDILAPVLQSFNDLVGNLAASPTKAAPNLLVSVRRFVEAWTTREPWATVFFLRSGQGTEAERLERLEALARTQYTRRQVFHADRWDLLVRHSLEPCESLYAQSGWAEAAVPALWVAVSSPELDDVPIGYLPQWLRRETRKDIERSLLGGQTLDEVLGQAEQPLPEEEEGWKVVEAIDVTAEQVLLLKELQPALATLTVRELEALYSDDSDPATRKARSRARAKVRRALGDPNVTS